MPSKSKVYFFFNKVKPKINGRAALKAQVEKIFREEGKQLRSLNYIFCGDGELLRINRQYLGHDYYTDIVTFDLSDGPAITAEIYISVDRVRENAGKMVIPFSKEIRRVMFHGALHLCGYGDENKARIQEMRDREDYFLLKTSKTRKSVSRGTFLNR